MYTKYDHHGKIVTVKTNNKGKHRENCLCFTCKKFNKDNKDKCKIADAVYRNCVKFGITTPVWECPEHE